MGKNHRAHMENTLSHQIKKILATYLYQQKIERMLDMCCGDGTLSVMFRNYLNIKEIYGIDVDRKALKKGEEIRYKNFYIRSQ